MATRKKLDPKEKMQRRIIAHIRKGKTTKWITSKLSVDSYRVGALRRSVAKGYRD